tara:strand:- start:427 stop:612 length:186 start_codon:yes stop_codon:yes gene_type:complete
MQTREQIIEALEDQLIELHGKLLDFQQEAGEEPPDLPSSYSVCFHYRREIERIRKALSALG